MGVCCWLCIRKTVFGSVQCSYASVHCLQISFDVCPFDSFRPSRNPAPVIVAVSVFYAPVPLLSRLLVVFVFATFFFLLYSYSLFLLILICHFWKDSFSWTQLHRLFFWFLLSAMSIPCLLLICHLRQHILCLLFLWSLWPLFFSCGRCDLYDRRICTCFISTLQSYS